jgi:putative lipoic acid-binding regulatory protein
MTKHKNIRGTDGSGVDPDSVTIQFPCKDYPIKIVGEAAPDYRERVLDIVEKHAPGFDRTTVTVRDSSNGRYCSVTVRITATGEPQLKAMFEDLKQHPAVRMVL